MKNKVLLTLLLATTMLATATAQKAKHAEIGIQAGYASVWIINQNNYGLVEMDYDYQWGPGFSFQAGYNFNDNIGLFTELGFARGGQKYTDTWNNNDDVKRDIDLRYLNVPLFFKYSYGESTARFRLLFGPQLSFLQKAEQEYTINGEPLSRMITDLNGNEFDAGAKDIKDRYNSTDIAIVLDLGADIFVMEDMMYLSIGARGYYGLTDINAGPYKLDNIDGNYDTSRNAGLLFNLGFHYIIGSK